MQARDFIKKYSAAFIDACKGTGLLPSVMMAQAAAEGGWGKSLLAREYHNHFGIKASKNATNKVWLPTKEHVDGQVKNIHAWFRTYESVEEGFADRIEFLKKNPRYTKAGLFQARTPRQAIAALVQAGYASDGGYFTLIQGIVNDYGLEELDEELKKKSVGPQE